MPEGGDGCERAGMGGDGGNGGNGRGCVGEAGMGGIYRTRVGLNVEVELQAMDSSGEV